MTFLDGQESWPIALLKAKRHFNVSGYDNVSVLKQLSWPHGQASLFDIQWMGTQRTDITLRIAPASSSRISINILH